MRSSIDVWYRTRGCPQRPAAINKGNRRKRADLIQVYKIMTGKDQVKPDKFFTPSTNTRTRGHRFKLDKSRFRTNLRKHFFTNRIIDDWNALPAETVEAETLLTFKTRLDKAHGNEELKWIPSFMQ